MKKILKETNQKGITLVALVITIIILLILATISIQALKKQGIFAQAENAKRESKIASIKEQIALDIYEKQLVPPLGSITEEQLETILSKYGTVNKEDDGTIIGITTDKGYEILLSEIYSGGTTAGTETESVPDGAVVMPINDITTWLKTGEISKQYSYTTIEQVIADSTCTESLMNNENAMKYLARSTEFADAICASETTMTYLGDSAYVNDTVLNSDLWMNTIKSSQYWGLVYASKTVTIYGAATETIKIEGFYGSFMTGTDGSCSHVVPLGEITLTGSVSEQSFTRMVTNDTTEVYVMPENTLYWYGNECEWLTGGFGSLTYGTNSTVTKYTNHIHIHSYRASIYTKNKIDLDGFSNVCVKFKDTLGRIGSQYCSQYICFSDSTSDSAGAVANWSTGPCIKRNDCYPTHDSITFTESVPSSALDQSKYVSITSDGSEYVSYIDLSYIYFE